MSPRGVIISLFLISILSSSASALNSLSISGAGNVTAVPTWPNCGTPLLTTTNQFYTSDNTAMNDSGTFLANSTTTSTVGDNGGTFPAQNIAILHKHSTTQQCSISGVLLDNTVRTNIFEWITIQNALVVSATPNTSDCDGTFCDVDFQIQSQDHSNPNCQTVWSGHKCALQTEVDKEWQKAYGLTAPDSSTVGKMVNVVGFAFWDWDGNTWWEMHPVTSWCIVGTLGC